MSQNAGDDSQWDAAASSALASGTATAQPSASASASPGYNYDPVLALQPSFAFSLVGQLTAQTAVMVMLAVLIVHLLFTFRYHYPLSRANFILQMIAAIVLLTSSTVTVGLALRAARQRSREWPYMFDYIEVHLPKDIWDDARTAAWYFLQAVLTLSCHATHIQFLTLLFPSLLEVRLILTLLVPLAAIAGGLSFAGMIDSPEMEDLADAIRTTCNSTLTLLYTIGLLIWGLLVNRQRAWRTDGGTSAFGAMAISLAIIGTAVNYREIHEDRLQWLPFVVWGILLWQSWAGFWWWVGSGMYAGEVEDRERRDERRRRREEKRRARRKRLPPLHENIAHRFGRRVGLASGVEPRMPEMKVDGDGVSRATSTTTTRRRRTARKREEDEQEAVEMRPLGASVPLNTIEHDSSDTSRDSSNNFLSRLLRRSPLLSRVLDSLSAAHEQAARDRADDQTQAAAQAQQAPSAWGVHRIATANQERRSSTPDVSLHMTDTMETEADLGSGGRSSWESDRRPPTPALVTPADALPLPATEGEGMGRDSLWWRGPIRSARLREVDRYD